MPGFVQPTIWNLSNTATGLQVSYSVAGPHLHYHHGAVMRDFTGSEIRVAEVPDLGTLVSVTAARLHSRCFSLALIYRHRPVYLQLCQSPPTGLRHSTGSPQCWPCNTGNRSFTR
jgi:hypothetical protein